MALELGCRIAIDGSNVCLNVKKYFYMYIDFLRDRTIQDIETRIKLILKVNSDICLMNGRFYLPSSENVKLLSAGETLKVVEWCEDDVRLSTEASADVLPNVEQICEKDEGKNKENHRSYGVGTDAMEETDVCDKSAGMTGKRSYIDTTPELLSLTDYSVKHAKENLEDDTHSKYDSMLLKESALADNEEEIQKNYDSSNCPGKRRRTRIRRHKRKQGTPKILNSSPATFLKSHAYTPKSSVMCTHIRFTNELEAENSDNNNNNNNNDVDGEENYEMQDSVVEINDATCVSNHQEINKMQGTIVKVNGIVCDGHDETNCKIQDTVKLKSIDCVSHDTVKLNTISSEIERNDVKPSATKWDQSRAISNIVNEKEPFLKLFSFGQSSSPLIYERKIKKPDYSCQQLSFVKSEGVKVLDVLNYPKMQGMPMEGDVIAFKILKMDSTYTPQVSDYIIAKTLKSCKASFQLTVLVLGGHEQCQQPKGKFDIDEGDNTSRDTLILNWNEMYDPRLLYP